MSEQTITDIGAAMRGACDRQPYLPCQTELDALIDAGADLAQAVQDILDDEAVHNLGRLQCVLDAWETAYALAHKAGLDMP
jgi:hypothetical protein